MLFYKHNWKEKARKKGLKLKRLRISKADRRQHPLQQGITRERLSTETLLKTGDEDSNI